MINYKNCIKILSWIQNVFIGNNFNNLRFIIVAIMVSIKYYDDEYYKNEYYAKVGGL